MELENKRPTSGYLAVVLNAHAPYLKHPRDKYSLDEYLLFDQILEAYLPLLEMLERLQTHNINSPITLSLSPTLLEMLASPIIQEHFRIYLQYKINLAKSEKERNFFDSQLFPLADYYWQSFSRYREKFVHTYKNDLIGAFADLHHKGIINLITTCATSAILPLLYPHSSLTHTQVQLGLDTFKRFFGFYPKDFWLPECAYNPGLEKILQDCGLHSTHMSACSTIGSTPSVPTSPYSPLRSWHDFIFYPNDFESTLEILSAKNGYYTAFAYSNPHRDLADEEPNLDLGAFSIVSDHRPPTGIKYYSNGLCNNSDIYNIDQAKSLAKIQAQSFIENRLRQLNRWPDLPHPPLITLSLNAEFLGSTWSEGYYWLEQVLRLAADKTDQLKVTTPDKFAKYLAQFPLAIPNSSSWLDGGFAERLINNSNNWVINYLNISNKHFYEMAKTPDPTPLQIESINQALRELLLAQASDWPLMLSVGENSAIARKKLRNYLIAFNKLYEDFLDGRVDIESLRSLQAREPIFDNLDYRQFFA